MPRDPAEPIWREDIQDQIDLALNLWKVSYDNYQAIVRQNAPPELVSAMAKVVQFSKDAYDELSRIQPYFPEY